MKVSLRKINNKIKSDTNWIAFRKIYLDLLKNKKVRTVFRPGSRPCKSEKGYCEDQIVKVRVIDDTGANWADLPPKFLDLDFSPIIIKNVELKKIKGLKKADFLYSTPDVKNKEMLKYHLGLIYNLSWQELSDDSVITKISFNYVN